MVFVVHLVVWVEMREDHDEAHHGPEVDGPYDALEDGVGHEADVKHADGEPCEPEYAVFKKTHQAWACQPSKGIRAPHQRNPTYSFKSPSLEMSLFLAWSDRNPKMEGHEVIGSLPRREAASLRRTKDRRIARSWKLRVSAKSTLPLRSSRS